MANLPSSFWDVFEKTAGAAAGLDNPQLRPALSSSELFSYFTYPTNTVMGFAGNDKKTKNKRGPSEPFIRPSRCELTGEPSFLRAVSVGCRCRFCARCCYPAGKKVRDKLLPIVEGFADVYMLTLTIDPKLWHNDPSAALAYLQNKRCIARLVRSLRRISAGKVMDPKTGRRLAELHTDRFFCSLEFQTSGAPHFHLLLDASRVDFDTLCVEWGRFRPREAAQLPVQDFTSAALRLESQRRRKAGKSGVLNWREKLLIERDCFRDLRVASKSGGPALAPAFGHVRFSSDADYINGSAGRKKAVRAAKYVTKYIFKEPEGGWPSWVLDKPRLRRFSTSHRFWSSGKPLELSDTLPSRPKAKHQPPPGVDPDCPICKSCGEYQDGTCVCKVPSIRDRLATCGTSTNIVEIKPVYDPVTLRTFERIRHLYRVSLPLDQLLDDVANDDRKTGLLRWDVPAFSVVPLMAKVTGYRGLDDEHLAQLEEWKTESKAADLERLAYKNQEHEEDVLYTLASLRTGKT